MLFIETARLNLLPDNARQFVREAQERYQDQMILKDQAHKRLGELTERLHALDKLFMSGKPISEAQAAERKRLSVDHDAASRRRSKLVEEATEAAQLFARIDRWLDEPSRTVAHMHRPSVEIVDVPLPPAKGDLEEVRGEIGKLIARRREVDLAPLPRPEIEARIRERVADMVKRGRPRFEGLDGRMRFSFGYPYSDLAPKPLTLLAWLDPEALTKRLISELPPATEGAMSASAKRKTMDDIDARQLELERLEEALVRATGETRRPDADIRAILSVDERPRAAKVA